MIGVIANQSEQPVISEFFELFKTPWEFYREGQSYEVVLCTSDDMFDENGPRLVVTYGARCLRNHAHARAPETPGNGSARLLRYRGKRVPIYNQLALFPQRSAAHLIDEDTGQPATDLEVVDGTMRAQVGYDLFEEIRTLLTAGQPLEYAAIPTLELHIALLRDLMIASGVPFVEIPPIPNSHSFIACLTHDVDHPSMRLHKFDHTIFGFLYRATAGSLVDFVRGRISLSDLVGNLGAALSLPLVYLGLIDDLWNRFEDYPKIEKEALSSFFVIPFKGRPGTCQEGAAPSQRAAAYGAADIASQIDSLIASGCEIGLHGIDAWHDSAKGREELQEIRRFTAGQEVGVRMHWLYFDETSPLNLERAGATYDSTVGYNETIGFRSGTTQAYKHLQTQQLLELPLHIMDTALFYPKRLNLAQQEAAKKVDDIISTAGLYGGAVTVNWHDRSIAPERNWGSFYQELIAELKRKGAWFATGAQAIAWFRKRRAAVFQSIRLESDTLHVKVALEGTSADVPGLRLHIHHPRQISPIGSTAFPDITISLNGTFDSRFPLGSSQKTMLSGTPAPAPGSAAYAN